MADDGARFIYDWVLKWRGRPYVACYSIRGCWLTVPPSTAYWPPVQKLASSEARKTAIAATSSTVPILFKGDIRLHAYSTSGICSIAVFKIAVSVAPGWIELQRILNPSLAQCTATDLVRPTTPALEVV